MWYIYTLEYYSAIERNEIGSFVESWMDLESVIQSESSQRKTDIYYCIYVESRKTVPTELCVGQEQRCRCRARVCGHSGGMNWEFRTDAHTAPRVKQITDGRQLCSSGNSAQSSVVTRTGGMGWTGVQEGRDLWKHTADSLPATAENNTAL